MSGGLGAAVLRVQLRELRYVVVPTHADPLANFEAVGRLRADLWLACHRAGTLADACRRAHPARSSGEGEIVAVQFRQHDVLVASICDPGVGFSLVGRRRCTQNLEAIRLAVGAGN